MQTSEQVQGPKCHKCDDLGVTDRSWLVANICDCSAGERIENAESGRVTSFTGTATEYLATLDAPDRRTAPRTDPAAAKSLEEIAESHARTIMSYAGGGQFQPKDMQEMIERFIQRAIGEAVPAMANKMFRLQRKHDAAVAELVDVKAALATAEKMLAARPNLQLVESTPEGQASLLEMFMDSEPEDAIVHGMGA